MQHKKVEGDVRGQPHSPGNKHNNNGDVLEDALHIKAIHLGSSTNDEDCLLTVEASLAVGASARNNRERRKSNCLRMTLATRAMGQT